MPLKDPNTEKNSGIGLFSALGLLGNVGLTLAGAVGIGMICGIGLDNFIGTGHLFTVVGGILGAAGGFLALYRKIMKK